MMKNYKTNYKIKSIPSQACIEPINESLYINTIISNNIIEKFETPSFKYIKLSSHSNIMNIIRKTNYISSLNSKFIKLGKDSYLYLFLHLALNILEYKTNIDEIKKHLSNLGFVEGAVVNVISAHNGDLILNVKDSRLALTKEMTEKIMIEFVSR